MIHTVQNRSQRILHEVDRKVRGAQLSSHSSACVQQGPPEMSWCRWMGPVWVSEVKKR